jgi:GNAT superfamily N-acetyltransferase
MPIEEGDILKFLPIVRDDRIAKMAYENWTELQAQDMKTRVGICQDGLPIEAPDLLEKGMVPELLAMIHASKCKDAEGEISEDEEDENKYDLRISGLLMLAKCPVMKSMKAYLSTHPRSRKEGIGTKLLASSIYWAFLTRPITYFEVVVALPNVAGNKLCSKFMNKLCVKPYSWCWYGSLVSSVTYILTNEDLLYDKYEIISGVIKEADVHGIDLLPYSEFAETRGVEK